MLFSFPPIFGSCPQDLRKRTKAMWQPVIGDRFPWMVLKITSNALAWTSRLLCLRRVLGCGRVFNAGRFTMPLSHHATQPPCHSATKDDIDATAATTLAICCKVSARGGGGGLFTPGATDGAQCRAVLRPFVSRRWAGQHILLTVIGGCAAHSPA